MGLTSNRTSDIRTTITNYLRKMKKISSKEIAVTSLTIFGLALSQPVSAANLVPTIQNFRLNGQDSPFTINEGQALNAKITAKDGNLSDRLDFFINNNKVGTGNPNNNQIRELSVALPASDNGTFIYTATVKDNGGAISNSITRRVTVQNVAPILTNFTLSQTQIYEGDSISAFLAATDPGADSIVFSVTDKNFGTRTCSDLTTVGSRSCALSLFFGDEGNFNFTGQAKDDDGGLSGILKQSLTVLNANPVIADVARGLSNRQLNFKALATDAGVNDILSYAWDFDGDGQFDDFFGQSGKWDFKKNGFYNVGLKVSDGDGGFAYSSFDVEVSVPEPTSVTALLAFGILGSGAALKRKKSGKV